MDIKQTKDKPTLTLFEGFSGIGAVSTALRNLNISTNLVGYSEIDKYAINSFCAIHNTTPQLNYGDINLIDETKLPYMDLYTFGSPCVSFSVSGKQEGSKWTCNDCKHSYNPLESHYSKRLMCPICNSKNIIKTSSSLVVEALRTIRHNKPKYLLMENVKNLVNKFKASFDLIVNELKEYGYNVYWKVLNSKDYGIPQSRERVIVVGIRKDIDDGTFEFPQPIPHNICLKDVLEEEVDNKYYLSEMVQSRFKFNKENENKLNNIVGTTAPDFRTIGQRDLVYGTDGIMGCLMSTDYKQPKQILELVKLGTIGADSQGNRVYDSNGMACTQVANAGGLGAKTGLYMDGNITERPFKIRKLTPLECFRLMGFSDTDYQKCADIGTSDTQLYKQAGNSIVVKVLEEVFKILFKDYLPKI